MLKIIVVQKYGNEKECTTDSLEGKGIFLCASVDDIWSKPPKRIHEFGWESLHQFCSYNVGGSNNTYILAF